MQEQRIDRLRSRRRPSRPVGVATPVRLCVNGYYKTELVRGAGSLRAAEDGRGPRARDPRMGALAQRPAPLTPTSVTSRAPSSSRRSTLTKPPSISWWDSNCASRHQTQGAQPEIYPSLPPASFPPRCKCECTCHRHHAGYWLPEHPKPAARDAP